MAEEFDINKIKDKILKLYLQSESERKLENFGAADLFVKKWNELLDKYNLKLDEIINKNQTEVKFVNNLGMTIVTYPFGRVNARNLKREFWFEELGKVIANGYGCYASVINNQGEVGIFGRDLDREMCVFMYLELANVAYTFANDRIKDVRKGVGQFDLKAGGIALAEWPGDEVFYNSFHCGFRNALGNIYTKYLENEDYKNKLSEAQNHMNVEKAKNRYYVNDLLVPNYNNYIISLGELAGRNAVRLSQKDNSQAIKGKSASLIKASKPKIEDKPTTILLIDDSGSMSGYKIEEAKSGALDYACGMAEQGYNIGLMKFGSQTYNIITPKQFDEKHFKTRLKHLDANSGGTNMASAIRGARSRFISNRQRRILVIVTDGGTTDGEDNTLKAAKECKQMGIEIVAIGCDGADEEFLKKLASKDDLAQYVNQDRLRLTMGELSKRLGA
jgi:Mg-chelatase subunit ChlD